MPFLDKLLKHEEIKALVTKRIKIITVVIMILLFVSAETWYTEMSNNNRRVLVGTDASSSVGVITYNKKSGNGAYFANYKFRLADKEFTNQTMGYYDGNVGDSVKILYKELYPVNNILASEAIKENIGKKVKKNLLITMLILLGFGLIISFRFATPALRNSSE